MWRITFALLSAVMFTATLAASVLADSHLPADTAAPATGAPAAAAAPAAAPVTAVPRAGVGVMGDPALDFLLFGLVGIACLLALLAVSLRWQRQRA